MPSNAKRAKKVLYAVFARAGFKAKEKEKSQLHHGSEKTFYLEEFILVVRISTKFIKRL